MRFADQGVDSNKETGLFHSWTDGGDDDEATPQITRTGGLVSGICRAGREYGHLGFSPPNGGRSRSRSATHWAHSRRQVREDRSAREL